MSLVNFVKLSASQYSSLRDKDEDTFYLVNDSGDFSRDTFEDNAKLYLGEKQIIPNKATTTSDGLMSKEDKAKLDNLGQAAEGDNTIPLFAGFMTETEMSSVVNKSADEEGGQIYCSYNRRRFFYKINSLFYAYWPTAYLYNDNYSSLSPAPTAKLGTIFSYENKHWIVVNGTLQDMSILDDPGNMNTAGIVKLSDSITGSTYDTNRGVAATPKALVTLGASLRTYTDTQISKIPIGNPSTPGLVKLSLDIGDGIAATPKDIYNALDAKIQLVTALPPDITPNTLYLISETPLSKPTEE